MVSSVAQESVVIAELKYLYMTDIFVVHTVEPANSSHTCGT